MGVMMCVAESRSAPDSRQTRSKFHFRQMALSDAPPWDGRASLSAQSGKWRYHHSHAPLPAALVDRGVQQGVPRAAISGQAADQGRGTAARGELRQAAGATARAVSRSPRE